MKTLPKALLKLSRKLFETPSEQEELLESFLRGDAGRTVFVRENEPISERTGNQSGFCPNWVVDAEKVETPFPTDYQLDLSSVFLVSPAFSCPVPEKPRVFDLCASPGGKSILVSRGIAPSRLYCNEVIQKRIPALISNLRRCRIPNVSCFSRDPEFFSQAIPGVFDLVLVDAPCSGQTLFGMKDAPSGVFHETTVRRCALRQRRIIGSTAKTVSAGGFLVYMTCTLSFEENEEIVKWFLKRHPEFEAWEVPELKRYRSPHSEYPAYRLFPHQGLGRGGFVAVFQCCDSNRTSGDLSVLKAIWKQEIAE